jgi:hypothetical protein
MTSKLGRVLSLASGLTALALFSPGSALAQQADSNAALPPPPPPGSQAAPPPGPAPLPPPIHVTFTADEPNAALEMQIVGAPGERNVDPRPAYRVAGPSVLPSDPFYLPQKPSVAIDAEIATKGGRAGWAVLTIGGGGLAAIGSIVFLTGALIEAVDDDNSSTDDADGGTVMLVGGLMFGGGAAMGIVGLVNLIGGESTVRVTNRNGTPSVALGEGLELRPEGLVF